MNDLNEIKEILRVLRQERAVANNYLFMTKDRTMEERFALATRQAIDRIIFFIEKLIEENKEEEPINALLVFLWNEDRDMLELYGGTVQCNNIDAVGLINAMMITERAIKVTEDVSTGEFGRRLK